MFSTSRRLEWPGQRVKGKRSRIQGAKGKRRPDSVGPCSHCKKILSFILIEMGKLWKVLSEGGT